MPREHHTIAIHCLVDCFKRANVGEFNQAGDFEKWEDKNPKVWHTNHFIEVEVEGRTYRFSPIEVGIKTYEQIAASHLEETDLLGVPVPKQ